MGVDVLSIHLDNPAKQYSPGQNVAGKLVVRVSGEETTSEITLRFFGTANTHWTESETHTHHHHHSSHFGSHSSFGHHHHGHSHTTYHTVHINYQSTEILFDFAVRLFGDGVNRRQIPVGDNVFPFSFKVPLKPLPVNCFFEDGSVVYGLEGRVRKPWYSVDPKTQVLPVTIFTPVDLNATPGAANAMQVSEARAFGCCCESEPCYFQSFSPRYGYCVGETVPLVVEMQNNSDRSINAITATLTQMWTLFSDSYERGRHQRTRPIALQAQGYPGVGPGQKVKWELSFTIPLTIPPSPNPLASGIIRMEYVIVINAAVEGSCCGDDNFALSHPLIVGNVPLRSVTNLSTTQVPKYDGKAGLA